MKLTLRQVLENTPLKEAVVLAGMSDPDREVTGANIIEVPDTVHWMRGGEILFSAGYTFGGDGVRGANLLEELNDSHICALALKPGKYMPEIPEQMIRKADEKRFPLLKIPEDMPYSVCMEAIFEHLHGNRMQQLRLITDLHTTLLNAGIQGGVQEICRILSCHLKRKVLLWDRDGVLRCGDSQAIPLHSILWKEIPACERPDILSDETAGIRVYCLPIWTSDCRAVLAVLISENEMTKTEYAVLQYADTLIRMEFLKEDELERQYIRLSGSLLARLLEGKRADPDVLHHLAKPYAVDLSARHLLFAIKNIGKREFSVEQLIRMLRWQTKTQDIGFLAAEKGGCCVGAFFYQGNCEKLCRQLLEKAVQKQPEGYSLRCGISREGSILEDIPSLAKEAEEVLDVLCRMKELAPIASLEGLGIYRVLLELQDSKAMQVLFGQTMDRLLEYDRVNHSELIRTLKYYFANQRNIRKTADAMFLHKNSVSYRLRKVEELTGRSLEDSSLLLELQLCIYYQELC